MEPEETERLFDRIVPWYDAMNRTMSLGLDLYWRRRAASLLPVGNGRRILDLATGTADLAIAAGRRGAGLVVGLDRSTAMLVRAHTKVRQAGLSTHVLLLRADAMGMPFPPATFDLVMSAFLLRNLPHLPTALAEMARVTRPGGHLLALEIAYPRFPPWRALFCLYFERIVPLLGRLLTRAAPAYRYLPASLARFPAPERVLRSLEENGWGRPAVRFLFPGAAALYTATRTAQEQVR